MTFNSIAFLVFLPLVWAVYWRLSGGTVRRQNAFVLAASYVFYGWWDLRFLGLMILTTLVDFGIARAMERAPTEAMRRRLLWVSLGVNLGALGFFKYWNFFAASLASALQGVGYQVDAFTLHVVLPVGISFYTFQNLSYTIDVYRRQLSAARDFVTYAAFITFFPQLVAGPIERAAHLMPQFERRRIFRADVAVSGLQLMLWGMFKKVVIADRLAATVGQVFGDAAAAEGPMVAVAAVCFALQIYGDFSGYSDMAVGCARLFGFDLMTNFRTPYFAASPRAFWQRWHISLSSWFRDYVYIPLGGNRGSRVRQALNLLATFLLSGLWHGANWTFVVWGALHGTVVTLQHVWPMRVRGSAVLTFVFVCVAWIFFRAASLPEAWLLIQKLPTGWPDALHHLRHLAPVSREALHTLLCVAIFGVCEVLLSYRSLHDHLAALPRWGRWSVYYVLITLIALFGAFQNAPTFIYFQF